MLIDLTCPAEVFQVSLPTEENPAAECSLYSLSDRIIVSADVTLKLQHDRGVNLEKATVTIKPLNARPHSAFRMSIPCNYHPGTEKAVVIFEKVRFSDQTAWERKDGNETEYTPNDLPVSKALTDLKFAAGETAKGFPSQQDGLWVCVCGRPNPDSETACVRCRQTKETVFARFNKDAVETKVSQREKQLDLATRSTREDLARLQRIREAEYRVEETRRKRRNRLLVCLAVFLVLTAVMFFWAEPALRKLLPEESGLRPETIPITMEDETTL